MIDLYDGIVGEFLMLCKLPVLLDDAAYLVHAFDYEHLCIPQVIFRTVIILA